MSRAVFCSGLALALVPVPWWLGQPVPADAAAWAMALVRPAALPFAWTAMQECGRAGNADEAFARAQQLLTLVPNWVDGHVVFAYRYALDGGDLGTPEQDRAAAAKARLVAALGALEGARATAGRREIHLLEAMACLPEAAVSAEPGLATLLRPTGGAPALADAYYAEAERRSPSPIVREHRTFRAIALAGALLDAEDPKGALAVLDTAIARSRELADAALAAEWRAHLEAATAHLRGTPTDLRAVFADARMAPLWPHLR
ncbi:MAG: hypothetical protein JNK49_10610 [Planctomycetes bacterium]|nr:hypothetical protein [Planctomycetota bacterium]